MGYYTDEQEAEMEAGVETMLASIAFLMPIYVRALEAGLVTADEQATLFTLQASFQGVHQRISEREAREDAADGPVVDYH